MQREKATFSETAGTFQAHPALAAIYGFAGSIRSRLGRIYSLDVYNQLCQGKVSWQNGNAADISKHLLCK